MLKFWIRWIIELIVLIIIVVLIQNVPDSWEVPFEIQQGFILIILILGALMYGREGMMLNIYLQALKERKRERRERKRGTEIYNWLAEEHDKTIKDE